MSKIKAVLFDFDGTLVNSVEVYCSILLETSRETDGKVTREDFLRLNGRPIGAAIRILIGEKKLKIRALFYIFFNRKRFRQRVLDVAEPYPEVKETVRRLAETYRVALVTSASRSHYDHLAQKFGLKELFEFSLTREEVPARKPAPDPYELAAKKLGLSATECLVIEDSPNGVRSGNRAGMFTCCLLQTTPRPFFVEDATPTFFLSAIRELTPETIGRAVNPPSTDATS